MSKDETAERLAEAHFEIEPSVARVIRYTSDRENDPGEPIKLIEVNDDTIPAGVLPIYFGPSDAFPYPSVSLRSRPTNTVSSSRTTLRYRTAGRIPCFCGNAMGTREAIRVRRWREAFARQSASDRDVYDALSHPGNSRVSPLPVCHRLHFLQMHLEKLAKAFLCQRSPADTEVARIQRTHNVISKTLPTLVKHYWSQFSNTKKPRPAELKRLRELCREIDLLAPALDKDQTRRDNCEYPWAAMQEQQSIVIAPCGHSFPVLARLYSHDASLLLKAASIACQDLQQSGPN